MKMKKYIRLSLLLLIGASFTACEQDLLDPFAPGAQTEEVAFRTPQDLVFLMNSAYSILTPTSEIEFNSVFTDEISIGFANGGQGINDNYAFILNPNADSPKGIWATNYITLDRVNRVIAFSDVVTAETAADIALLDQVKAEAYTMRAYCHNQLLSYFSTNPADPNALGVVKHDQVFPTTYRGVRVPNSEIYALIDADLQTALDLFASSGIATSRIKANKDLANGTWARSYALRKDYANALIKADAVISGAGLNLATFGATGTTSYTSVYFTDSNTAATEVIFKLKKLNGETRVGAIYASVNSTLSGSPFYEMGRGLFNILDNTQSADAAAFNVTTASGTTLTIPGHNYVVGDMVSFQEARPSNAVTTNGVTTSPANSIVSGKVYWVRQVTGDNVQLSAELGGTSSVNFGGAAASLATSPVQIKGNDGDVRYHVMVHPQSIVDKNYTISSDPRTSDKLVIRKYPGTATNGFLTNDIKIMRLSEMYLIKAEAQIATGDLTGAATTMRTLRNARFNKVQDLPVYADAAAAWRDVLFERRKELAFEGFRYIDLKRLGAAANQGIERDAVDCAVNGQCSMSVDNFKFTLPIPTTETGVNGAIQQNPGY